MDDLNEHIMKFFEQIAEEALEKAWDAANQIPMAARNKVTPYFYPGNTPNKAEFGHILAILMEHIEDRSVSMWPVIRMVLVIPHLNTYPGFPEFMAAHQPEMEAYTQGMRDRFTAEFPGVIGQE